MNCKTAALLGLTLSVFGMNQPSAADLGGGLTGRPKDNLPPLPDYRPATSPRPFDLPPLPTQSPASPSAGPRFMLRHVEIAGNTVFTTEELHALVVPYLNQTVSVADLEALRLQLTQHYVEAGYVSSGAVLPDQQIQDGQVHIDIVEGRLTDIRIEGQEGLRPAYVQDRLQPGDEPLNIKTLQQRFQLLLTDPLIERLNGALRPGLRPGENRLDLQVTRAQPYKLDLTFSNHHPASTGANQAEINSTLRNLTGFGDALNLSGYATESANEWSARYDFPLNAQGTLLSLHYENSYGRVSEAALEPAEIESDYWSVEGGISHPVLQSLEHNLTLGAHFGVRSAHSYMLGRGIAFTPGVEADGSSRTSVLRLFQDYGQRGSQQVLAVRSTFNLGLGCCQATEHSDANLPDSRYFSWLGQLQYARRLGDSAGELRARANLQLSADPLLPLEQFSVGGAHSVRGYRENEWVRDNGFDASLEYRYPLLGHAGNKQQHSIEIAPFFDVGSAWNHGEYADSELLYSVGVGLIWSVAQVQAQLYYGYALNTASERPDHNLQDEGIHFLLNIGIF